MGSSESTPQTPTPSPTPPLTETVTLPIQDSSLSPSAVLSSSALSASPLEAYLSSLESSHLNSTSPHPPAFPPLPFRDPFSVESNSEWKSYLQYRASVIEKRYLLWEDLAEYDLHHLVHPSHQRNPCSSFQKNLQTCAQQSLSAPSSSNQCFRESEQLRSCMYHKMTSFTDAWGNLDKEIDFHNRLQGTPSWNHKDENRPPTPATSFSYKWDPLVLAPIPPSISVEAHNKAPPTEGH